MRRISQSVIIVVLFALAGTWWVVGRTEEVKIASEDNKLPQKEYDWMMDQKTQMEFFERLVNVKIGETRTEIIHRLGLPSYDEVGTRKEDGKFIVRSVTYYIKRLNKELVNEIHDRMVILYFNEKDALTGAFSNVENYQSDIPEGFNTAGTSLGTLLKGTVPGKGTGSGR